jgi:hypothetical protein
MTRSAYQRHTHDYLSEVGLSYERVTELLAEKRTALIYELAERAAAARRWDEHLDDVANNRPTWWDR